MKKFLIVVGIIFLLLVAIVWLEDDEETDEVVANVGDDTYTLMVYMCASDLESEDGSASADIDEMLAAKTDSKVNVILETGGTIYWQDHGISSKTNQRYKVESGKLNCIEKNLGLKEMTDPATLSDFISYCKSKYPAEHYGLVLWDHGGGSVSGYGYDENSKNPEDTLTLDELKTALKSAGVKFDFIGFDACLMATAETAYTVKDYANYLIASEETEPGTGWEYKSLINQISKNTSQNTTDILKKVVDEFIKSNNGWLDFYDATLSVIDLSKVDKLYSSLCDFMMFIEQEDLDKNNFAYISKAISDTKSFADGEYDTIDLYDFAKEINNSKSAELESAIEEAVAYYKNNDLVEDDTHGISLYLPYTDLTYYDDMLKIYDNIGISQDYTNVITKFVNIMAGGRKNTYTLNSHEYETGTNYYDFDWYDQDIVNEYQDSYYDDNYEDLEITDKGEYYALELSDEDWEYITNITCEVLYDDEEGYIDLGSDDYYEFDNAGDLKIVFDGYWVAINEQIVPFYSTESTETISKGKVPALVNDDEVNIIIVWDDDNPNGKVLGYEPVSYGNTTLSSKGVTKFKKGDEIEFLFDYYDYDGNFDDQYIIGDKIVVGNDELTVSYEYVGDGECYVYYKLTDIFNNEYYTEALVF